LPLATLLAGAAIPGIGVRYGWRTSFVAVVALAATLLFLAPQRRSYVGPPATRTSLKPDVTTSTLVVLAVGGALSTGAVNTMGAFYVESALRSDLTPGQAGWWLAAGSLAAVSARIGFGASGDRIKVSLFRVVAMLWAVGAVGVALFAPAGSLALLAVGTLVAFAAGSGWTGLYFAAIIRSNPSAPASATGTVMTGEMIGSVLGPLAFGAAVSTGSYTVAWLATAAALLLGAALLPLAERLMSSAVPARVERL
jgi:predicted MFS family arabinose efflux permease